MKYTRCDRCDAVIPDNEERQVTINNDEGDMKTAADDLCPRCVKQLLDFLRPLPQPAPTSEEERHG